MKRFWKVILGIITLAIIIPIAIISFHFSPNECSPEFINQLDAALAQSDHSICENFPEEYWITDPVYDHQCEQKDGTIFRTDDCYYLFAVNGANPSICHRIAGLSLREECFSRFGTSPQVS